MRPLTLRDIHLARRRIASAAYRTPLERSDWLSELAGCDVYLKLECWQRTRSFKVRGAFNAVATLTAEERARGLVAASAGNHGQGVALAAREAGIRATIFVPSSAPAMKQARIRSFGAELEQVEGTYDDAEAAAVAYARETGATFVHAYSDPCVVAGQGTIALEVLETLPELREVIVPVGGGGLIAGIGLVMSAVGGVRVVGVQSELTRSMHDAFEAGAPVPPVDHGPTLADGLAGGVEEESYERARPVTDEIRLVGEDSIAAAIRELYRRDGLVVEGAGATAVALLRDGYRPRSGPAVLILSGGNIDAGRLADILESK